MTLGRVIGIAFRTRSGADMCFLERARVLKIEGIAGDCKGRGGSKGIRQITVLSFEQWQETCQELGVELLWPTRRANLFVEGLRFCSKDVGKVLVIGANVLLEITGETKPCEAMDKAHEGLKMALAKDYRGGVTCRVLSGGFICEKDEIGMTERVSDSLLDTNQIF